MDALDGNAIAGPLLVAFGKEMTMALTTCRGCVARSLVAELRVYVGGPGAVARCRSCDTVLLVLAEIRGIWCVGMPGLAALDSQEPTS